jgi:hypothetical protein
LVSYVLLAPAPSFSIITDEAPQARSQHGVIGLGSRFATVTVLTEQQPFNSDIEGIRVCIRY